MRLYEIADQYQGLMVLGECDEMKEAVADTLESISDDFNSKATALSSIVLNFSSDIDAIDQEIERLKSRKTAIKNKQESLTTYLRENMERTGIKKIDCPLFSITCAQGREVVVIDDETALPDEYVSVKTEIKPNKTLLAATLKEGQAINGARLERSKSSIRIK